MALAGQFDWQEYRIYDYDVEEKSDIMGAEVVYRAGNSPLESAGYVSASDGVSLETMKQYCEATGQEMAEERGVEWLGCDYEPRRESSLHIEVLEFKHIGPFPGCWSRWEYIAVHYTDTGHVVKATPIVWTPRPSTPQITPMEVVQLALDDEPIEGVTIPPFKCFEMKEWGDILWKQIPYNYIPNFSRFAEMYDLEFTWPCANCGEEQTEPPKIWDAASWRGNRGVGVEVQGWLCDECQEA